MELPVWYGQRDGRWAGLKLGFSPTDTIGNYGCLVTCIAIMVDAFDYPKNQATPIDVNNWLKSNNGYVDQDLVIWAKVPQITTMDNHGVSYSGNIAEVANYLNSGDHLAICEVRMNGYMHFVLGYKSNGKGDAWVHDPWTNTQRLLSSFGRLYAAHLYGDGTPVIPVVVQPPVAPPTPPVVTPPVVDPPVIPPVIAPPVLTEVEKQNLSFLQVFRTQIASILAAIASWLWPKS